MTNTQKIREACIKANPEIVKRTRAVPMYSGIPFFKWKRTDYKAPEPIDLADVLLARIKRFKHLAPVILNSRDDKMLDKEVLKIVRAWNLKEKLENQSEKDLRFIADLL